MSAPVDLSGLEIVYTLSRSPQSPKHAVWLEDVRALMAAAPAPATPAASVDTAEFVAAKDALIDAGVKSTISGASIDVQVYLAAEDHFIEVVSAHTARAVADAYAKGRANGARDEAIQQKHEREEAATQQHAQAALSIGAHKPFELATKALHQDWTPETVHHLIDVVDQFIAASHQPAAAQADRDAFPDPRVAELRDGDCLACLGSGDEHGGFSCAACSGSGKTQPEVKP